MYGPPLTSQEISAHLAREVRKLTRQTISFDQAVMSVAVKYGIGRTRLQELLDRYYETEDARRNAA